MKLKKNFKWQTILNPDADPSFYTKKSVAFVDYENLYYGFMNKFRTPPLIKTLFEDFLLGKFNIRGIDINFFGDFTKYGLDKERDKVRSITNGIIDCAPTKTLSSSETKAANGEIAENIQKDFTDFIMLDNIYQKVWEDESIEQIILFTGDAHFCSAVAFFKNTLKKSVGIIGVRDSLNPHLARASTWCGQWDFIDVTEEEEKQKYHEFIVRKLCELINGNIQPRFTQTASAIARDLGEDIAQIEQLISRMVENGEISQTYENGKLGTPIRVLRPIVSGEPYKSDFGF